MCGSNKRERTNTCARHTSAHKKRVPEKMDKNVYKEAETVEEDK